MKRSTLLPVILSAVISLAVQLSQVRADISYTGEIDPDDLSAWGEDINGYVGKTDDGTLTINGGSKLYSFCGCIGNDSDVNGTVTVGGEDSTWTNSDRLYVGKYGAGTLKIINGGKVISNNFSYIAEKSGSTGEVTVDGAGSMLTCNSMYFYIGHQGDGTLKITNGGKVDLGICYIGNSSSSTGKATIDGIGSTWTGGSTITIGYNGSGTLYITNRAVVDSVGSYIASKSGSAGDVTVDGTGSTWTCRGNHCIGHSGEGELTITNGGKVISFTSSIGDESDSTGKATVDGTGSTWTNDQALFIGNKGSGTLNVSGGSIISAARVSINSQSLLAIDVGNSSMLHVFDPPGYPFDEGILTNNGTVRILAGAGVAADGTPYSPISAITWEGSGVYQAVGGTWDTGNHEFLVSAFLSGDSGDTLSLTLADTQRALVVDSGAGKTGWTVGASFLHKTGTNTDLDFTASVIVGESLELLADKLDDGQTVKGAWEFTAVGDGYSSSDPVYLSFAVGEGWKRNDLHVWRLVGTTWSEFDAMDLTCNDGYASFTVTGFSGYAVTVPEPGTLLLLIAAALGLAAFARLRRK